ncbi:hypothetical protein M231_02638 [Tremella mesenterica]|uniref:Uncharacterized protein n=1 Tax=Tremella mesenterica TaxID=5217 RepID=A0A4Q1BQ08_TREME|nr:hypothetical protein M231_02638 [Tremella mesenterica]
MPFALPALPSGIVDLLDRSPPVVYPSHRANSPANTPTKRRDRECPRGRERSQSHSRSPHHGRSHSISVVDPTSRHQIGGLGLLPGASASVNDITSLWQRVPRSTIPQPPQIPDTPPRNGNLPLGSSSVTTSTPPRPTHRRALSAIPATPDPFFAFPRQVTIKHPSPMGRLQEYSRNPLASVSAVSLPTLAETDNQISSPTSPLVRPVRPMSRASLIRTPLISPLLIPNDNDREREPVSPMSIGSSLPDERQFRLERDVFVPPPQPHQRRPWSPRSQSAQEINTIRQSVISSGSTNDQNTDTSSQERNSDQGVSQPIPVGMLGLDGIKGNGDLKSGVPTHPSMSLRRLSLQPKVSDVAVLATWSFPSSPTQPSLTRTQSLKHSHTSKRLHDLANMSSNHLTLKAKTEIPPSMGRRLVNITHRHTHSSPNLNHLLDPSPIRLKSTPIPFPLLPGGLGTSTSSSTSSSSSGKNRQGIEETEEEKERRAMPPPPRPKLQEEPSALASYMAASLSFRNQNQNQTPIIIPPTPDDRPKKLASSSGSMISTDESGFMPSPTSSVFSLPIHLPPSFSLPSFRRENYEIQERNLMESHQRDLHLKVGYEQRGGEDHDGRGKDEEEEGGITRNEEISGRFRWFKKAFGSTTKDTVGSHDRRKKRLRLGEETNALTDTSDEEGMDLDLELELDDGEVYKTMDDI